jgi:hypothetical protein
VLSRPPASLVELIWLTGLARILPCDGSGLQPRRQAEAREEPRGVEEEGDPGDSAV